MTSKMKSKKMNQENAINRITERGALLVFPLDNRKEPSSLWSEFFPKTKMRWEWDESGDNRVGELWSLMKKLSSSGKVVYSKWYKGRATFFSRELFTALLCLNRENFAHPPISHSARELLDCLESDSPLSTKELKKLTDLRGKDNERIYHRGMKELFDHFLIVAFGEVDDGAFPSLAVGATRHLFEGLLHEAEAMDPKKAERVIEVYLPPGSSFRKYLDQVYFRERKYLDYVYFRDRK